MLTHSAMTTIVPVRDLDRARRFYADGLGLTERGLKPNGQLAFALGDGGTLALFPKPDASPSPTTLLSFAVPDIVSAIDELERHGVQFEDYDLPGFRTVDHVCVLGSEKAAWFKDPDGNILCLHQDLAEAESAA